MGYFEVRYPRSYQPIEGDMKYPWIFAPYADDSYRDGSRVVLGEDTQRIMRWSSQFFYNLEGPLRPQICVPAGWDPDLGVIIGHGLMRPFLERRYGIPLSHIASEPHPPSLNGINGEIIKLVDYLKIDDMDHAPKNRVIHVSDLLHRIRHTTKLLREELGKRFLLDRTEIETHIA